MNPAPPLVLLHGFTGTAHSFDRLELAETHCPLLAGHGPDPHLDGTSFADEVQRLACYVERLGRPAHVVGYSMGARVALGLALARGELIERLTLIGVNPGLRSETERQERLAWESRWQDVLDVDGLAVFEHKWHNQPLFASQQSLPPMTLAEQKRQRLSHTARGLSHALEILGLGVMPDLWPLLSELSGSVQLLVGARDEKFGGIAAQMSELVPHLQLNRLPNVGHNPLLEAPDLVRALVLSSDC